MPIWGRRRWVVILPLALLLLGTLLFHGTSADLSIASPFYDGEIEEWDWKDFPVFAILYRYGTLPAAVLAAIALVLLVAGLFYEPARKWRKIAAYYILVVVIAPGLLVNAVFKEHWGRPRPREVTEFEGREQFEKVWEYDASSPGKSFPSGHASMGFCLFGLYFIGRALRQGWARWTIPVALGLGGALGLARIAQGGHFASDVMWSAGFCYFTALGLAWVMRLGERPLYSGGALSRGGWAVIGIGLVGAAALAVAVPYQEEKRVEGSPIAADSTVRVEVKLDRAELAVVPAERFLFTSHVEAFGMVGSKLLDRFEQVGARFKFSQNRRGSFATVEQPATLHVPEVAGGDVRVKVRKGSVTVDLFAGEWDWDVEALDGDVVLRVPPGVELKVSPVRVGGEVTSSVPGLEWSAGKGRWKRGDAPTVKVRVRASGDVRLEPIDR